MENFRAERIILPVDLWESMCLHVNDEKPLEACGILGGKKFDFSILAQWSFPARNEQRSTSRFRMDPQDQLFAFNQLDQRGLDLVGIYHSHPHGPPSPSKTDIEQAYYPEAVQLIWAYDGNNWDCRSYIIQAGQVQEIPLVVRNNTRDQST